MAAYTTVCLAVCSPGLAGALLYLAGVVLDAEAAVGQAVVRQELGVLAEAALKVLVLGAHRVQLVQEGDVRDRAGAKALLVQHGQDAILVLGTTPPAPVRNIHSVPGQAPLSSVAGFIALRKV